MEKVLPCSTSLIANTIMEGGEFTCTFAGIHIKARKSITSRDIVLLCELLEKRFGKDHTFQPERSIEGGIIMTHWPGDEEGGYKSFRFDCSFKWPWVRNNTRERWKYKKPFKIIPKGLEYELFLRAFRGAPCWKKRELRIVSSCFRDIGCTCKGTIPRWKDLVQWGELGKR